MLNATFCMDWTKSNFETVHFSEHPKVEIFHDGNGYERLI